MTRDELAEGLYSAMRREKWNDPHDGAMHMANILLELIGTAGTTAKAEAPPEPKRTRGQIAAEAFLKRDGLLFQFSDPRVGYGRYVLPSYNGWDIDASISQIRGMLAALIDAERADAVEKEGEACAIECEHIAGIATDGWGASQCAERIRARKDGTT